MPGGVALFQCPIQPGALHEYYFGSWEKNGVNIVDIPRPINGAVQNIRTTDSRYSIDRATFSLLIDPVELTDSSSYYQCNLYVENPITGQRSSLQQSSSYSLSLNVSTSGKLKYTPFN